MKDAIEWERKWFGVWKEHGPMYAACPSVYDFVKPEIVATYDKHRLRHYLENCPVIVSTSRSAFPNPFTGELCLGTVSYRTDGTWVWIDDLPDYIEKHDVAIPRTWLQSILSCNYNIPVKIESDSMNSLEFPPVG